MVVNDILTSRELNQLNFVLCWLIKIVHTRSGAIC